MLKSLSKRDEWAKSVDAASLCPMPEWCEDKLLHELIFSMLLWESSIDNAIKALTKIHEQFVDYNELRVCFPHEIESILGSRYQRATERSERLIAALRTIFENHQQLSLQHLNELTKREARAYLESLEVLPKFVIARLMLLGLEAHAIPLDAKLARALHKAGLIHTAKDPDSTADVIERVIRASQSLDTYTRLERWLVDFENGKS